MIKLVNIKLLLYHISYCTQGIQFSWTNIIIGKLMGMEEGDDTCTLLHS